MRFVSADGMAEPGDAAVELASADGRDGSGA